MKKNALFLLPIIVMALVLNSCSSDTVVSENVVSPNNNVEIVENPFAMSAEDAMADVFDRNLNLRSGFTIELDDYNVKTTVFNVKHEALSKSKGKEVQQQVPVYTVSYKDQQGKAAGFVLTIGDERVANKVLAYSEEGEDFDFSDEGGAFWEYRFKGYIHNHINNKIATAPRVETRGNMDHGRIYLFFNGDWPQSGDPYNRFTPYRNNQRVLAGAEAIAMAEIMSSLRWPQTGVYKRYTTNSATPETVTASYVLTDTEYDWLRSSQTGGYALYPNVMSYIGNLIAECGYRLNTNYQTSGSQANPSDVPAVFSQMGFLTDGYSSYTFSKVETDIATRGLFVFMAGWNPNGGYHSFIVRGLEYWDVPYLYIVKGNNWNSAWVNEQAFSTTLTNLDLPYEYSNSCMVVTNIRKNPNNTGCTNANWRVSSLYTY
ncbi:MAG: C10 family peptidase [Tannerella sp.]|jgi:hypothetical protein|nr:C10 family peptidase [Tannerella sp.]